MGRHSGEHPAQVEDRNLRFGELDGDSTNGEAVFSANCASCHGADGTGGSGPNLVAEAGEDDAEWVEVILGGEDTMPAFVDVLTDQEIADVLAWLKS